MSKIRETQIAGSEIKFFVVKRIVGNVHFAIFAEKTAVGVDHRAGVVVNAGSTAFEKRNDQRDFALFRDLREFFGRRARDRLGKIEKVGIFLAAKIFAAEKFMQRDDLRAARGGFTDFLYRAREIFFRVCRAAHLHQADGKFVWHRN